LNSLLGTKAYEEVISLVTRLVAKDPQYGDYYVKRGLAYAALNKRQEALGDFVQAMGLSSHDLDLFLSVERQGAKAIPNELMGYFHEKVKAHPEDVPSRMGLADLLLSSGQGPEAAQVLASLTTDTKAPYRKLALRMSAMAKYMAKDYEGAYQTYLEVLKLAPDDLEVLNNVSFLLAEDLKRPKEGLKYAEEAVKILRTGNVELSFVNNGNVYDTYGWVKFLAGDVPGAITELRRALQIEPSPIAYYHLARVLVKARPADMPGARRAVTEGIRLASQTKDPTLSQLETLKKEIGAE
jgi:tetratricopeptide (TPR) repeat protein